MVAYGKCKCSLTPDERGHEGGMVTMGMALDRREWGRRTRPTLVDRDKAILQRNPEMFTRGRHCRFASMLGAFDRRMTH